MEHYRSIATYLKEKRISKLLLLACIMHAKSLILGEKKSYFAPERERLDVQKRRDDYIASIDSIDPNDMIIVDTR
jgi:hypothetical protein